MANKKSKQIKYTTKNFEREFPDNDTCLEWLKNYRFPEGIECPTCKKITKFYRIKNRPCYKCDICGDEVYPLANTIFHKSSTPLKTWFQAMYYMSTTRSGRSAKELQRITGVTYKTAWRMFKQIRSLLGEDSPKLNGIVEMDETYVGGKSHDSGGRTLSKTPVIGVTQRQGEVRTKVTENVKWATVTPFIIDNVARRSVICTDEFAVYNRLNDKGYIHRTINHRQNQYRKGIVHTNTIEGFCSLVKRGIDGVYHCVSPKYLQSYINEYSFRYNHRYDETPMFRLMLNQIR